MNDYFRIPEGFFNSDTMKGLRTEDNGTEATLIYMKLAAHQGNNRCIICNSYDELADLIDEDQYTLEDAILTLVDYDLIEATDSGAYMRIAVTMPEDVE